MVRATKTSKTSVTRESSSVQDTGFADATPTNNTNAATPSPQSKNKTISPNKKRKRASEPLEGSSAASKDAKDAKDKKRKVKEEDGEGLDVDRDDSGSELGEDEETGPFLSPHHARSALEVLEAYVSCYSDSPARLMSR